MSATTGGGKARIEEELILFGSISDGVATSRDPTDAAQVPPSVLRQHVGDPSVEHGDISHRRSDRHQSLSHQDAHRGI